MYIGIAGPIMIDPLRPYLDSQFHAPRPLPAGLGGTPVLNLVREFLTRSRKVTVFTLDPAIKDEIVLTGPQLKICIGPYRPKHRARDLFAVEREYLQSAIRREKPDVVHAHWIYEFALAALASGTPTLVTAHDAPLRTLRLNPSPYRFIRTFMGWQTLRRTSYLTAVSDFVAEHLRDVFRYKGHLEVVPNTIPSQVFDTGGRRVGRARAAITFAANLSGWGKIKNCTVALQAFQTVRKSIPDARLLLFGAGHGAGGPAEQWAAARGLTAGVEFAGEVAYAALLQRLATEVDVLVHPARAEALSMAVAEAMAIGLPVIAGATTGGMSYLLEGGRAGVLVNITSPAEVAEAMLCLAQDSGLRRRIGQLAHQSVLERFNASNVITRYLAAYERLLASA
jgi:glycosyltransferase involved in cell wall biosynthesis